MFRRESGIVTYGGDIISYSIGSGAQVAFDFDKVWSFARELGDSFNPDLLHFIHSHPPGCNFYSLTDLNCIKGFNVAFNFPVRFSIVVFDNYETSIDDLNFNMLVYKYINKEMTLLFNYGNSDFLFNYEYFKKWLIVLKSLTTAWDEFV